MEISAAILIPAAVAAAGVAAWLLRQPGEDFLGTRALAAREKAGREKAEAERDGLTGQLREVRHEVVRLLRRVEDYSQAADVLTADDAASRRFFNGFDTGIAVSSKRDGGTILWVNRYVAERMGYARDELLALGWSKLIHPDDLKHAVRAEASAHDGSVVGFVARYRRHESVGGGWIRWRWDCRPYNERGLSACRLTEVGIIVDPMTILVAEDDAQLRKLLQLELEAAGMTVTTVPSGELAVAEALALRPAVVLMDLVMPGIGGAEAARRIVAAWPEARIVVLTGSSGAELPPGCVAVLTKPVDRETLLSGLAKARRG